MKQRAQKKKNIEENWKKKEYDQSGNIPAILKQSFSKMGNYIKNWY